MKIGLNYKATPSIFGSGRGQAVLAMASVCRAANHEVVLFQETDRGWWDDVPGLASDYTIQRLTKTSRCDLLIDVDGELSPDLRSMITERVIIFLRSDPTFEYLEKAVYMSQEPTYSLQGVHEVWVWDLMVSESRLPILETMLERPVKRVPYVWSPDVLKEYVTGSSDPCDTSQPLSVVIGEKNTTNTSSCLVPLLGTIKASTVKEIVLLNATRLKDNQYFQENLVNQAVFKSSSPSPPIFYEGRMRYADLTGCVMVSHVRHVPFRPGLLDLLWLNLPLIHNCALLKSMGTYYDDNDVEALTKALETFSHKTVNRELVEDMWSVAKGVQGWSAVLQKKVLRITFTDMWEGFEVGDNFFLDLMRSCGSEVIGTKEPGDLLICGPFGPVWQEERFRKQRKVYYSGEPPFQGECVDARIDLFLTHSPVETDRQLRLPIWQLFVEWFGGSPSLTRNPNRLPKDLLTNPSASERTEFCAFVVSNPLCVERNAAFDAVNAYKRVNSGGRYKNNLEGGPLAAAWAGGGGGDTAKVEFYKKHRFVLCYENSVAPGYVTEKLLHAKMAGCIPLYRGALEAATDFDPDSFVHVQDGQDVVQLIRDLEADPVRAEAIARRGALGPSELAAVQQRLNSIGQRLVDMASVIQKKQSLNEVIMPLPSPLFVSFATAAYLPALRLAIQSVETLRKQSEDSGIRMIVYLGADISSVDLGSWVQIRRLPEPPAAFPDMYEPKMFGWKLQILHDLCLEEELAGTPVLYADAGAMWLSVPQDMLTVIQESGVCLVKDRTQINRHWCSEPMVKAMGVSLEELEQNQLMASVIGFKAGSVAAQQLFVEALKWGSQKEVLFGPYCAGVGPDGHPFGHRHDQSILSILIGRYACPLVEGMRIVCESSLRKAYQKSTPVYLHRGKFTHHQQVIPGIDDIWGISLDRRPDRWQSLLDAHPDLVPILNRLPGIDGRLLELTPDLTNLFAKNDFQWKKSVTGCALSHILVWAQLASEHPLVQNYLILEDDCRFVDAEWTRRLAHDMAQAPIDADLLMLGGVLPSNLHLYQEQLESVNDTNTWATLKPNNLFSPNAVIPFFHFCAYSYVLTKTGAKKLLASLQTKGVYTSIDHYLMHPQQGLKTYVLKDLMTTCFQADNPIYKAAAFDDFLRVDTYDSDIWNNKECFLNPVVTGEPIHVWNSLIDVLQQAPHNIQTRNTLRPEALLQANPSTVYYLPQQGKKADGTMEEDWLKSLWPGIQYLPFPSVETLPPNSWLLVARPHLPTWTAIGQALHAKGTPFRVLHLSDEGCSDPIDFYKLSSCKKVIRNYRRPGLDEKVRVLPLGPGTQLPSTPTPSFSERPFVWGFHGTNWSNREALLKPLLAFHPHLCHWTPEFKHKTMTGPKEYQQMLLKSQFVPVPRGNNVETFRLYEALDHGAIPLYVRTEGDEVYWSWLRTHLNLLELISWDQVPTVLELFRKFPEKGEGYRTGLLNQWAKWRAECATYFP